MVTKFNLHTVRKMIFTISMGWAFLCIVNFAAAREYFVDINSVTIGFSNGSKERPWRSLQRIFDERLIGAGDSVEVSAGSYGRLIIKNRKYSVTVTISAKKGDDVKLGNVQIINSQNLHMKNFIVSPVFLKRYSNDKIVEIVGNSKNITIEGFEIYSVPEISSWSKLDWREKAANGIFAVGSTFSLIKNQIRNVSFGITAVSDNTIVAENSIINYSGDGLRGLGNHSLFEKNIIKNCYQVDGNHADGFQSWSTGKDGKVGTGEIVNVIVRKNLFINYEDPNQKFGCNLQGIGLFDGMFVDWIIENNIVIVDQWHGITVMGARNVRILNNTVWDRNNSEPGPAWIMIAEHKNGTKPQGNVVANNLASRFNLSKIGVLQLSNQIIRNPENEFVNYKNYNFRLKAGSRAINSGMDGLGVTEDFYGNRRPRDGRIDVGAVEYQH